MRCCSIWLRVIHSNEGATWLKDRGILADQRLKEMANILESALNGSSTSSTAFTDDRARASQVVIKACYADRSCSVRTSSRVRLSSVFQNLGPDQLQPAIICAAADEDLNGTSSSKVNSSTPSDRTPFPIRVFRALSVEAGGFFAVEVFA